MITMRAESEALSKTLHVSERDACESARAALKTLHFSCAVGARAAFSVGLDGPWCGISGCYFVVRAVALRVCRRAAIFASAFYCIAMQVPRDRFPSSRVHGGFDLVFRDRKSGPCWFHCFGLSALRLLIGRWLLRSKTHPPYQR